MSDSDLKIKRKSKQPVRKVTKGRGRPRKPANWTAELLNDMALAYFSACDSTTREVFCRDHIEEIREPTPYSIEGLCCYLHILKREFSAWRKRDDELGRAAQLIYQRVMQDRIEGALLGRQNSAFAQFMLKNNNPEDYRDKVEVEASVSAEASELFSKWSAAWKTPQQ